MALNLAKNIGAGVKGVLNTFSKKKGMAAKMTGSTSISAPSPANPAMANQGFNLYKKNLDDAMNY